MEATAAQGAATTVRVATMWAAAVTAVARASVPPMAVAVVMVMAMPHAQAVVLRCTAMPSRRSGSRGGGGEESGGRARAPGAVVVALQRMATPRARGQRGAIQMVATQRVVQTRALRPQTALQSAHQKSTRYRPSRLP